MQHHQRPQDTFQTESKAHKPAPREQTAGTTTHYYTVGKDARRSFADVNATVLQCYSATVEDGFKMYTSNKHNK